MAQIDAREGDLSRLTATAWDAVVAANVPPERFRHGDAMSRIERDDNGDLVIRSMNAERLRLDMATIARFTARKKGDNGKLYTIDAHPTKDLIASMLASPNIPLPVLNNIVSAPIFGPNGTLQLEPGYHPAGRPSVAR